ncbi:unnamed protein product [Meganyctiphanes norvegica]|uniref:Uncharacterized protein n=1 Tax=Meganyctiphanes norvegica TaxID=48144 RepID=A0AAV2R927_MEGNR
MALEFYPFDFDDLIEQVQASMDESTVEKLNREIRPVLEKLAVLEPGENRKAAISQLSVWLNDTERTGEEFSYVVGPLGVQVFNYMRAQGLLKQFGNIMFVNVVFNLAEALAVKSPVLEGSWEHATWFFVHLKNTLVVGCGTVSKNLSEWIIGMMGHSDMCPSPYLRLEFLKIFDDIEVCVDINNQTQTFESVMFACSSLELVHMKKFILFEDYHCCINLNSIFGALKKLNKDEYLQGFDQQLSDKLLIQTSVMIKDVSCMYGLNPNRNTYIYEINIITALFDTISEYAQQELMKLLEMRIDPAYQMDNIDDISKALLILITCFKKSCQTPQLANSTAMCIIDVVEVTLLFYITMMTLGPHRVNPDFDPECLTNTDQLLGRLSDTDVNVVLTCVGQTINQKYQGRLSNLRQQLRNYNIDTFSMICSLLYHCNYDIYFLPCFDI